MQTGASSFTWSNRHAPPSPLQVPGLFTAEELAKELTPLEDQRKADPVYSGPADAYSYFMHRVRQHLHLVVSLDPSHEQFKSRLESNPALLTR